MRISFVTTILLTAALALAGTPEEHLTFQLDFEQGLTPATAKGAKTVTWLGQGKKAQFAPALPNIGVNDRSTPGSGFATGREGNAISIPAKGNISTKEGTLLFFVKGNKGVKWNQRDDVFQVFFSWQCGPTSLIFYKYGANFFTRFYDAELKQIHPLPPYKEDEWNCFALTWRGTEFKWYLNGEIVGQTTRQKPLNATDKDVINFGQAWGKQENDNRVQDDLRIYDRVLLPQEIFSIYAETTGLLKSPRQMAKS